MPGEAEVWTARLERAAGLRLDESVAKFYRAMGPGYQARINRILATFAQMRMVEVKEQSARIAAERARLRAKLENG